MKKEKANAMSELYESFWAKYEEITANLSSEEQQDNAAIVLMCNGSQGVGYSYSGGEYGMAYLLTKLFSDSTLRPLVERAWKMAQMGVVSDPIKDNFDKNKAKA